MRKLTDQYHREAARLRREESTALHEVFGIELAQKDDLLVLRCCALP
ncbi:hypothetical protein [Amycolatopsis taiwanensis]|nr:hypothetical protein [Amycolatopsis taiwanensis]